MIKKNRRRPVGTSEVPKPRKRLPIRRARKAHHPGAEKTSSPRRVYERAPVSYLVIICLVVAVVAAAFVFHLHVRFEGVRLGYETSQARAERARLLVERRELRLELASLKAPQRVEAEARERLGMEMPDYRRIIPIGKKRRAVVASGGAR